MLKYITLVAGMATGLALSTAAHAGLIDDPLHGFCNGAGACVDNGSNTPLGSNSTNFGFSISPGPQTGNLFVDLLVPNNYVIPASFSLTGIHGGTANNLAISAVASLFGNWTSGDLGTFLGFSPSSSPANPIGAFLPATQALDPAATGFFVFQANIGTTKIWDNANGTNGPVFNMISAFSADLGGYIVGFCGTGCTSPTVATAPSGALLVNGPQTPPHNVPEPSTLALFGIALVGIALFGYRRKTI